MFLGLYIHVPFCKHACPYCDFYKIELRERPARERLEFPAIVRQEHELLLGAHPNLLHRAIDTIYFGGGTPSTLSPPTVAELIRHLTQTHGTSPQPEVTLEANPENLTPGRCEAWLNAGITRLSIGVQTFQPRHLERLERLHGPDTINRAMDNARAAGFTNISIDLMFALPEQTEAEWLESLDMAIALQPDHLSFYGLTIHEQTPFHDEAESGQLVPIAEDIQASMYLAGAERLERAGFEHYEISNFARPGFRSRHNQRYWLQHDVVGLGPGAHSNLGPVRWRNPEDIDAWRAAISNWALPRTTPITLDLQTAMEEAMFRMMRRRDGFPFDAKDDASVFFHTWLQSPRGEAATREGWIAQDSHSARLTREGWLRSDALLLDIVGSSDMQLE
jgi:oxygen-independent coproporphyrinogen-3 oxidase